MSEAKPVGPFSQVARRYPLRVRFGRISVCLCLAAQRPQPTGMPLAKSARAPRVPSSVRLATASKLERCRFSMVLVVACIDLAKQMCVGGTTLEGLQETHPCTDVRVGVRRSARPVNHRRGDTADGDKPTDANAMPHRKTTSPAPRPMPPREPHNTNSPPIQAHRGNPDSTFVGLLRAAPTYTMRVCFELPGADLASALWNTSLATARAQSSANCDNGCPQRPGEQGAIGGQDGLW